MFSNSTDQTNPLNWETFQQLLPDYVEKEIKGQDADAAYPHIALLVETSPAHEEAYHLEYRRQVMAAPATELSALGPAPAPWASAAATSTAQAEPSANVVDDAVDGLYPKVVDSITLWIERGLEICRGLEFDMPAFSGGSTLSGPITAGAGGGIMGDDHADAPKRKSVHLTPEGAPVELTIDVKDGPQEDRSVVEIGVALEGRFGDYSGVTIILEWGEQLREAVTNTLGQVRFTDLPHAQLPLMRVRVILPDDE